MPSLKSRSRFDFKFYHTTLSESVAAIALLWYLFKYQGSFTRCVLFFFYLRLRFYFRIEWVVQVSMKVFRRCILASLRFSFLCVIATKWRPYPFCAFAIAFLVCVVTGLNKKKTPFQLLVVQLFPFPKCCLLLSEFSEIIKEMTLWPIQRNRHIGKHAMLATRRQRRLFFVFMFWQMQHVKCMLWVHPINEMHSDKGEFYVLYPDLQYFPPKFFNMYRMSVPKFDAPKVAPKLQRKWTIMREPLSPEQKLVITLR